MVQEGRSPVCGWGRGGPLPPAASTGSPPEACTPGQGVGTKGLGPQHRSSTLSSGGGGFFERDLKGLQGDGRGASTPHRDMCLPQGHGAGGAAPQRFMQGLPAVEGAPRPDWAWVSALRACFDFYLKCHCVEPLGGCPLC